MYGKLSVELKAVTSHSDTVLRRMEVAEKKLKDGQAEPTKTLPVTQLQLISWAEQGLPQPMAILSLIDHLTSAQMSSSTKHTVVMCRSACIVYIRYTYIHIGYCMGGRIHPRLLTMLHRGGIENSILYCPRCPCSNLSVAQ